MKIRLYPLGYPVEITSDDGRALDAANQRWGAWECMFAAPAVPFVIQMHGGRASAHRPRFEASADGFLLADDCGSRAAFDLQLRQGSMDVCEESLRRPDFLEACVLTALDWIFFTPIHAGCVIKNGRTLLLCGDSGVGKSTLAYACMKAGWTFVSDDGLHWAAPPHNVLVPSARRILLREPARALFPEILPIPSHRAENGKTAILISPAIYAKSAVPGPCVFLSRGPGKASATPYSNEAALTYFLKYVVRPDPDCERRRFQELLQREPAWLLQYEHLDDGVQALEQFL
jgi:hypothetical protein